MSSSSPVALSIGVALLDPETSAAYGANKPLPVKGDVFRAAASFVRPADTTAYAVSDLIANSTASGAVTPMQFDLGVSQGLIRAAMFKTSTPALVAGSSFRLHLWSQAPITTGGDNAQVFAAAAGLVTTTGYLGYIDMTVDVWGSDGAMGRGAPLPDIHFDLGEATKVYGLIEARSAITPANAANIACTVAGVAA